MKRRIIAALLLLCSLLCGCAGVEEESTEICIIPVSYWAFSGMTPEEGVESFESLEEGYYTSVEVVEEGVQLELTKQQRDKLIQRNNEFIEELAEKFLSCNEEYRYVPDESYHQLAFYFDEKIPMITHVFSVYGIACTYGMNDILLNHTQDWSVDVSIYNCHTDQLVVSVQIPNESVTYGDEEWAKSYEE